MPIKRRSTLPKPTSTSAETFVAPGPSLESLVRKHDALASDASWNNDHETAAKHSALSQQYRERIAAGELYEPDF